MGDKGGGMFLSTLKEKNDARRAQQQLMKAAQSQATITKKKPSFMGGFGSFLSRSNSDNLKKNDDDAQGKAENSVATLKQVTETSTTTTAVTDDATGRANSLVREETTHKSIVLENGSESPIAMEVEEKTVVATEENESGETVRRESRTVTIALTAEPTSPPTTVSGSVVPLGGSFWNKSHLEDTAPQTPVIVVTQTETTTMTVPKTTDGPAMASTLSGVRPGVIPDQPSGRPRRASTATARSAAVDKRVSSTAGYVRDASSDHSIGGRERTPSVATMEEVYRGVPRDSRNFEMLNPLLGPEVVQRRALASSVHETGLTEAKRASLYNSAPHVDQVMLLERRNTRAGRSGSIDVHSAPLAAHDSSASM